jgi:hypothetical protein
VDRRDNERGQISGAAVGISVQAPARRPTPTGMLRDDG